MLDRAVELSADLAAGTVEALLRADRLRRTFAPRRALRRASSRAVRAGFQRGRPLSLYLSRRAIIATARMAPLAWTVARDPRTWTLLGLLTRVIFGHRRRYRAR